MSFKLTKIEKGIAKAQGGRKYQEDRLAIDDSQLNERGFALYSIFDGHGGEEFAEHAKFKMHEAIIASEEENEKDHAVALYSAFLKENSAMKEELVKQQGITRGGTTATVALITSTAELFVGNVGDSRCILAKREENYYTPIILSRDHNLYDHEERERVENAGGQMFRDRVFAGNHSLNMTRALGDFDFKNSKDHMADIVSAEPSISFHRLKPEHEFLVLASDGLWNLFKDEEVVDQVSSLREEGLDAKNIAEALVKDVLATARSQSDNVTIIILFFHWGKN